MQRHRTTAAGAATAGLLALAVLAPAAAETGPTTLASGLDHPHGVAIGPRGRIAFTLADGTVRDVVRKGPEAGTVRVILRTRRLSGPPAVDINATGLMFVLTTAAKPHQTASGSGLLFRWSAQTGRRLLANIRSFQRRHPDPFNVRGRATASNPSAVAGLPRGGAVVTDQAANDVLVVSAHGAVRLVARIKPRRMPGTTTLAESAPTAVTIGSDGYWYVGERRGWPGTPGTSEIWRIAPGARGTVCDPAHPQRGACRRWADGLTSLTDLESDSHGGVYATELSVQGWRALQQGKPGSRRGALLYLSGAGAAPVELLPGQIVTPGGVGERADHVYASLGSQGKAGRIVKVQ